MSNNTSNNEQFYDHLQVESKWQKYWSEHKFFDFDTVKLAREEIASSIKRKKFYSLAMLPYPSGKLHMGHVRNYTLSDVLSRYRIKLGDVVLHPMGWDAFGLPAENAAKQNNSLPDEWTFSNIETMREQLKSLGYSYNWNAEVTTCTKEYYRWEQKLFIQMYQKGLVERKNSQVNWCESCATVLANEQVEDGECWRCGSDVIKRDMEQWFFKITKYADELLDKLDELTGWPEQVKTMQRNWIGRSVGLELDFDLVHSLPFGEHAKKMTVFTTRPDTIYGVSAMMLSIQYPNVLDYVHPSRRDDAIKFIDDMKAKLKDDPYFNDKEKYGFDTGMTCTNPINGEAVSIWLANYVLIDYGTGAVMSVPAHDERDYEFAKKFGIKIKPVITPPNDVQHDFEKSAYTQNGFMINCTNEFNGKSNEEFKQLIVSDVERKHIGKSKVNFKLRDWGISRQRYWGTPIPMIHCKMCGVVPAPIDSLPVVLPVDVDMNSSGNPVASSPTFVKCTCPKCGAEAVRETDTMDTFMESSWYFLRYCDAHNDKEMFDRDVVNYYAPVDQYVGGVEHAVMHLLYARFFTKVLRDLGYLDFDEPFTNLYTQAMVVKEIQSCPEHGYLYPEEVNSNGCCVKCGKPISRGRVEKMSKSKKNVVSPADLVAKFGADTVRLFSMFAAPPNKELEWSDNGVEGMNRFIHRLYRLVVNHIDLIKTHSKDMHSFTVSSSEDKVFMHNLHSTIKKVGVDIEAFQFNTAIASVIEFVNYLYKYSAEYLDEVKEEYNVNSAKMFAVAVSNVLNILSPFTPHLCDELSNMLGFGVVSLKEWSKYSDTQIGLDTMNLPIQVNGKLRATVEVSKGITQDDAVAIAKAHDKVKQHIDGKEIVKIIFVQDRIFNIVVK